MRTLWIVVLLASVQFTHIVDFMIIMPLGPKLMEIFEISPRQFGFLVSAYTFSAGLSALAVSRFADDFDRKRMLLFFFTGFIFGTLMCGLAPNYEFMLLARILTGAFGGIINSTVFSIVSDFVAPGARGKAVGMLSLSFAAASVIGVPSGLWLSQIGDWHTPFFSIVGLGVFLIVLVTQFVPPVRAHLTERKRSSFIENLKLILSDLNSRRALAFSFLHIFGHFSLIPFISPSLVSNAGMPAEKLGYVYLLGGLAVTLTSPIFGRLSDKFGAGNIYSILVLISMFPILALTNLPATTMFTALTVTTLFFITTNGRMVAYTTLVTGIVPNQLRGRFMSLNSSIQQFGMGFAAMLSGLIVTRGTDNTILHYSTVGFLAIGLNFICFWMCRKITYKY